MNTLHYCKIEKSSPTNEIPLTLLFIHGWGWHSGIWEPLIPALQPHFNLILVDLPGFGKSPPLTGEYTFSAIAEKLLPILSSPVVCVGWSLGGMLAWWLAIHYPEKISHLVTIASSPKFIADENWPGVAATTLEKFSQSLQTHYQKTLEDFLELQLRGSPHQVDLFSLLKQQLANTPQTALPALSGGLEILRDIDLRTDLAKIHCPSLHLFGQLDVLTPTKIIPFISAQLPNSQCEIISRTGHIPFLTHPDYFLQVLHQFLL